MKQIPMAVVISLTMLAAGRSAMARQNVVWDDGSLNLNASCAVTNAITFSAEIADFSSDIIADGKITAGSFWYATGRQLKGESVMTPIMLGLIVLLLCIKTFEGQWRRLGAAIADWWRVTWPAVAAVGLILVIGGSLVAAMDGALKWIGWQMDVAEYVRRPPAVREVVECVPDARYNRMSERIENLEGKLNRLLEQAPEAESGPKEIEWQWPTNLFMFGSNNYYYSMCVTNYVTDAARLSGEGDAK